MLRRYLIHGLVVALIALAALVLIRLHNAQGAQTSNVSEGHRLAEAWCKECHLIDMKIPQTANIAPDFAAIANQPSTTELSLKVFLGSNHRNMPNLILEPEEANNLVGYILSLKRE